MASGLDRGVQDTQPLRICVGIATKGRPLQLEAMLKHLRLQTLAPTQTLVCCTAPDDAGAATHFKDVTVLYDEPGSSRQRNGILNALPEDTDLVAFFDDDFYPDPSWLETIERAFRFDKSVNSITGFVVADGILGPGLLEEDALAILDAHDPISSDWVIENYSPYGCNMVFRCSAIKDLRFDERLVLYGWLEDLDFGASLSKRGGRCIKLGAAFGVHLGIKGGRVSGRKFGYSQVMNPVYIYRKNSMTFLRALNQICRNVLANIVKSVKPEPYVDRRGRLLGNLIAAGDLIRRRISPERASSL